MSDHERLGEVYECLTLVDDLRRVAETGRTRPTDGAVPLARSRIDRHINDTFVRAGALMLQDEALRLQNDPESWKRIQRGTYLYRTFCAQLFKEGQHNSLRAVHAELVQAATGTERFAGLIKDQPLIGGMVAYLSCLADTKDKRIRRPFGGWFADVMRTVTDSQLSLERYAQRCTSKAVKESSETRFIADLKHDINSFLVSCAHMACSFAMHAQKEDCAVFMPQTSYHVPPEDRETVRHDIRSICGYPVYRDFPRATGQSGVFDNEARVPTFMSVVDLQDFVHFFAAYLHELERGNVAIDSKQRMAGCEGRIRMRAKNRRFGNFNLRVDYNRRGNIALDFSGMQLHHALDYARQLGKDSERHEMVMHYSSIVDANGLISAVENPQDLLQRGKRRRYVSVMMSSLPIDVKASLVAAGIIAAGKDIVFPYDEVFTYHLGGKLNTEDHRNNFNAIARRAQSLCG